MLESGREIRIGNHRRLRAGTRSLSQSTRERRGIILWSPRWVPSPVIRSSQQSLRPLRETVPSCWVAGEAFAAVVRSTASRSSGLAVPLCGFCPCGATFQGGASGTMNVATPATTTRCGLFGQPASPQRPAHCPRPRPSDDGPRSPASGQRSAATVPGLTVFRPPVFGLRSIPACPLLTRSESYHAPGRCQA
jgi:hypothetical protein